MNERVMRLMIIGLVFFLGGSHIDWEGISDDRYNY